LERETLNKGEELSLSIKYNQGSLVVLERAEARQNTVAVREHKYRDPNDPKDKYYYDGEAGVRLVFKRARPDITAVRLAITGYVPAPGGVKEAVVTVNGEAYKGGPLVVPFDESGTAVVDVGIKFRSGDSYVPGSMSQVGVAVVKDAVFASGDAVGDGGVVVSLPVSVERVGEAPRVNAKVIGASLEGGVLRIAFDECSGGYVMVGVYSEDGKDAAHIVSGVPSGSESCSITLKMPFTARPGVRYLRYLVRVFDYLNGTLLAETWVQASGVQQPQEQQVQQQAQQSSQALAGRVVFTPPPSVKSVVKPQPPATQGPVSEEEARNRLKALAGRMLSQPV
jgi:hypothetical protein